MAKIWITKLCSLLLVAALIAGFAGFGQAQAASVRMQPSYGAADIDGEIGEWDLQKDYFADLYRAGNAGKEVEAKVYLRYDCATSTMYALILTVSGVDVLVNEGATTLDDAFIKVNPTNSPVVSGNTGDDNSPPDFAWIGLKSGPGGKNTRALGWEASFPLPEGAYASGLNIHTNVFDGGEQQTAGSANNGIPVNVFCTDYGDLPASFNATLLSDNGARHRLSSLYLGELIDGEADGIESPQAVGDDQTGWDDGDGVRLTSNEAWTPGTQVNLLVTVHGTGGCLAGWFDWNGNGTFDTGELVELGVVNHGSQTLNLTVPASYTAGNNLYARFRLFASCPEEPLPTGEAVNGEVEDYLFTFKPTAVHLAAFQASSGGRPLSLAWVLLAAAAVFAGLVEVSRRLHSPQRRITR